MAIRTAHVHNFHGGRQKISGRKFRVQCAECPAWDQWSVFKAFLTKISATKYVDDDDLDSFIIEQKATDPKFAELYDEQIKKYESPDVEEVEKSAAESYNIADRLHDEISNPDFAERLDDTYIEGWTEENLNAMTVAELRVEAERSNVKFNTKTRKADLIAGILDSYSK